MHSSYLKFLIFFPHTPSTAKLAGTVGPHVSGLVFQGTPLPVWRIHTEVSLPNELILYKPSKEISRDLTGISRDLNSGLSDPTVSLSTCVDGQKLVENVGKLQLWEFAVVCSDDKKRDPN